ncbi:YcxB family protein [Saccharothrix violaceirubra]|uniref:YcxB-like protein n=1 Tax=Saccharothrix violaceirubra TaxID=413306 RepID=A0A7W7WVW9_9PSEU|nr:YcxB family protein [Saccharothrix violaceirubra]MBB4964938.1 hypothetical protein [Saccharothrix violaceirubra]
MSVDFAWTPRPADWWVAQRTAVPLFRWAPLFALVLCATSLVVLWLDMLVPAVFGLVLAFVIFAAVPIGVSANFRGHPLADRPVTGSADAHSMRMVVGDAARTELGWVEVPGWTESSRVFVVRAPGDGTYAIPHRAFADAQAVAAFRALLVEHVGPAA